jgi:hypothetical protein
VLKKVVIPLESNLAEWVRKRAVEEGISVSMLIARVLEREMHAADRYWRAFQDWKKRDRNLGIGIDVSKRFTRDEAHER